MRKLSLKSYLRAETGVAAIEMAFIMPFMLLLYFGLMDLTGHISLNRKITAVASATADLVGQNRTTIIKSDVQDYFQVAGLIMKPKPITDVKVTVYSYRLEGSTVTQKWKIDNGVGPACVKAPDLSKMNLLMTAGNDLIVAQACTTYTPNVVTFLGNRIFENTTIGVEQIVTLRPRASLQLNCKLTSGGTACP